MLSPANLPLASLSVASDLHALNPAPRCFKSIWKRLLTSLRSDTSTLPAGSVVCNSCYPERHPEMAGSFQPHQGNGAQSTRDGRSSSSSNIYVANMLRSSKDTDNKSISVPEPEANIDESRSTTPTSSRNLPLQHASELVTLVTETRTAFTNETDMTSTPVH